MQRLLFFLFFAALALMGCGGEAPSPSPEASSGDAEGGGERLLNIGVDDETSEGASPDSLFLRAPDRGFWHADLSYGGTSDAFGYYPVEEPDTFYVYPQGRAPR